MVDEPNGADPPTTDEVRTCWGVVEEGFRNAQRLLAADIEAEGLPVQWFEVLTRLYREPDHQLPMNRLAATIEMTSGGFTKLVDRLEAAHLVERVPAVDDRRVVFTALTSEGLAAAQTAEDRHEAHLREVLLAAVSPAQLRELSDLMSRLRDAHGADDGCR